jgi:hypothetical protein
MPQAGNQEERYSFSSTGYSPKAIYARSVDSRGHQAQKRLNLSPALLNSYNMLYKELGYSSPDAMMRDALVHRLKYWQDNAPEPERIRYYLAPIIVHDMAAQRQECENSLRVFDDELRSMNGQYKAEVLDQVRYYQSGLPDFLSEYSDRFTDLIKRYS